MFTAYSFYDDDEAGYDLLIEDENGTQVAATFTTYINDRVLADLGFRRAGEWGTDSDVENSESVRVKRN